MASKKCDSCKISPATLFCRADSAFLCVNCDSEVHAANKLASRHARVLVCEVCEQAPAHVTCKADAAALCVTCDRDIHSANPLAQRHERVAITPFYDSVNSVKNNGFNFLDDCYYPEIDGDGDDNISSEEAEAASWLLPNPNPKAIESPDLNSGQFLFPEMDPYQDLDDYGQPDLKTELQEQICNGSDGVVPDQPEQSESLQAPMMNRHCYEVEFSGAKSFGYNCNNQSRSQSLSSSSLEVCVVPESNVHHEISNPYSTPTNTGLESTNQATQYSAIDREARVMRYREKRKNRKFEKTIRYASRKAYAETRPRIKGRFAKRTVDAGGEGDRLYGFGVVPSF